MDHRAKSQQSVERLLHVAQRTVSQQREPARLQLKWAALPMTRHLLMLAPSLISVHPDCQSLRLEQLVSLAVVVWEALCSVCAT
jgi:hypothetical protein